ncbi:DUF1549 domain-containing protein [Thalassoroseus pseudoceratinae]|uniref:DUF1549 domain-containing protein n=1 Tax=Thalassoroseus pseudoceratinae TaxID=2713176 RepID=UPI001421AD98|nr:DUF1549 domain-containing protein [Thalassoroseus pseudoceratinae]
MRGILHFTVASVALLGTVSSAVAESKLAKLHVFPQDVHLTSQRDRQSLVIQAEYADGLTKDVTAEAKFTLADATFTRWEDQTLWPVKDGSTTLAVEYAGAKVEIPVNVKNATVERPISFHLDVMPVFMKAGCNMGSCHGAARGKDGFRLSLFGFDPVGDHFRLTREYAGRRINLALPEESLLVTKSIGMVPHTGGKRFDADSELNETFLRWLRAGVPLDQGEIPKVVSVELNPPSGVLDGEGTTQKLTVRAKYSDGTDRDVTHLAYFSSNNDNSAEVSQKGVVTAHARGESFIMARFETHTVGSHFITLPKGLEFTWSNPPENNYIDQLINQKLRKLRINPSELCTDEEFLRRAYLDIIGVPPTTEEYHAFLNNPAPDRREQLVDELLNRKEFVELWVMKWAELLQVRTVQNRVDYKSMLRYYNWLKERVQNEMPMDQMVQELLGANGGTFANAATNYYQAERDTLKTAENVAQVFMGMRIQCAQCHNHPFDRWTMDDYFSFAAFFSQIGRKRGEDPRETIVYNRGSGEVKNPVTNKNMAPKFLGGAVPDVKGKDRREVLAKWLASPENPYFAKNLGNIVWAHFFGRGIIDQVDDVRISNPAVNQELLDELGQKFTEYNYDFKKLVRDICTSRTYQLSTATNATNATDTTNFSHAMLRRLRSEVMLDSISQITNTKNKFQGLPLGARAVQIANGNTSTYFLTTFGRAKRETVCSCEVSISPNLSQALHMLNGDTVNSKIQQGKLVATLLGDGKSPQDVLKELYIRTLCREPNEKERAAIAQLVAEDPKNTQQILEDVFWALLNSREFLFNH